MARIFRHTYTEALPDGRRLSRETRKWYIEYRERDGIVKRVPGFTDRKATEQHAADLERRVMRAAAGVFDESELVQAEHGKTRIDGHVDAYEQALLAAGVSAEHRCQTVRRLRATIKACGFARLSDIRAEPLNRLLNRLAAAGKSARTRNTYLSSLKAFVAWAIEDERLATDRLSAVKPADEKTDVRRQRRSLTEAELRKLLDVARTRPLLDVLTIRRGEHRGQPLAKVADEVRTRLLAVGRERALIYKTLVLTGLRKGELASLTVGQVELDRDPPIVVLNAADEKNRAGNSLPLHADLADDLRRWLRDRLSRILDESRRKGQHVPLRLPADAPLFNVPHDLIRILDRDLKAAGIPKRDERGRTLDVHALRHTFGTLLSKAGVSPRTAQQAMRHGSIDLTMNTYTDPKLLDTAGAVNRLPSLPLDGDPQVERQRATGTDGKNLGVQLGVFLGGTGRIGTSRDASGCTMSGGNEPDGVTRESLQNKPFSHQDAPACIGNSPQRATRLERATFSLEG